MLLRDRMIEMMLAAAAALISPESGGRREGIARNAMFAVKRTAAYTLEVYVATTKSSLKE